MSDTFSKWVEFPPFYTIQPNTDSRSKQLGLWRDYIVHWAKQEKKSSMALAEFPLFENKKIGRKLDLPGRQTVVQYMIDSGNGEWEDSQVKLRCTIFFKKIDDWAGSIYKWVSSKGMLDDPFTCYEIRCGEDQEMAEFYNMDELTFNKAIALLVEDGRAKTFHRNGEAGVTFYELAA